MEEVGSKDILGDNICVSVFGVDSRDKMSSQRQGTSSTNTMELCTAQPGGTGDATTIARAYREAHGVLLTLRARHSRIDLALYNTTIAACGRARRWREAPPPAHQHSARLANSGEASSCFSFHAALHDPR